jgi:hypothetical protein
VFSDYVNECRKAHAEPLPQFQPAPTIDGFSKALDEWAAADEAWRDRRTHIWKVCLIEAEAHFGLPQSDLSDIP